MRTIAIYSFNKGKQFIEKYHKKELKEIEEIIEKVKAKACKTKVSKEKTKRGKRLYSPIALNNAFEELLQKYGWKRIRIKVKTTISELNKSHRGFREIDAVKNKLGVEVQFGKYAFMVYNVAAKMTIFSKQNIIDSGIEIVPMLSLAKQMSTGVSYFEQMKTDLEYRGVSNIDIPVLILGVGP